MTRFSNNAPESTDEAPSRAKREEERTRRPAPTLAREDTDRALRFLTAISNATCHQNRLSLSLGRFSRYLSCLSPTGQDSLSGCLASLLGRHALGAGPPSLRSAELSQQRCSRPDPYFRLLLRSRHLTRSLRGRLRIVKGTSLDNT